MIEAKGFTILFRFFHARGLTGVLAYITFVFKKVPFPFQSRGDTMPKITMKCPWDDSLDLRVTFKPVYPPDWSGMDDEDRAAYMQDDDADVDILIKSVELGTDGEFVAVESESELEMDLYELEFEVKEVFVEKKREQYVNRLARV